jgi:hypothetical protein
MSSRAPSASVRILSDGMRLAARSRRMHVTDASSCVMISTCLLGNGRISAILTTPPGNAPGRVERTFVCYAAHRAAARRICRMGRPVRSLAPDGCTTIDLRLRYCRAEIWLARPQSDAEWLAPVATWEPREGHREHRLGQTGEQPTRNPLDGRRIYRRYPRSGCRTARRAADRPRSGSE